MFLPVLVFFFVFAVVDVVTVGAACNSADACKQMRKYKCVCVLRHSPRQSICYIVIANVVVVVNVVYQLSSCGAL